MKTLPLSLLVILLAFSGAAATKPKSGSKKPPEPAPAPATTGPIREISIEDTEILIKKQSDINILDVRTAEELESLGRIKGAKNLDFLTGDFDKEVTALGLDPTKPCIVYCAVGGRAKRAAEKMVKLGFKEIIMPKGSFNAWKSAGKPVEGGKQKP